MTLVELMIAMFVTSILLASVATVFTGTLRGVRTVNAKTSTAADARIAMEAISRTLRVAYTPAEEDSALVSATATSLSFYALLNRTGSASSALPLPTLIEYGWDGTCLTEAQTPGRNLSVASSTGSIMAWDTGRVSKCLARTTVAPDFSYYLNAAAGTEIPIPAVGGLSLTARQTVGSIEFALTIQDPNTSDIKGVPIVDRATLINVQINTGG
jgi:Tfp pilus assembly protein PilW